MTNRERIDRIVALAHAVGQYENPCAENMRKKIAATGDAPELLESTANTYMILKDRLEVRINELVALMGG